MHVPKILCVSDRLQAGVNECVVEMDELKKTS